MSFKWVGRLKTGESGLEVWAMGQVKHQLRLRETGKRAGPMVLSATLPMLLGAYTLAAEAERGTVDRNGLREVRMGGQGEVGERRENR